MAADVWIVVVTSGCPSTGQQRLHRDAGFHPRQVQAHAGVFACRERDVRGGLSEDVERLGAGQRFASRLAEPMQTSIIEPAGISTPSSSVSSVANRCTEVNGVS